MSLFIPALMERGPPRRLPPHCSSRGPCDARGCQRQILRCGAGPAAAHQEPGASDGAATHHGSPACIPPPPPSCPTPTHSFSRARSPKKEPFSSTVILLLLSSLWEEQRERGSPVT